MKKITSQLLNVALSVVLACGLLPAASYGATDTLTPSSEDQDARMAALTLTDVTASFSDVSDYPWVLDGQSLKSSNQWQDDTTCMTEITFICDRDIRISFDWAVSSEENWDFFNVALDSDLVLSGKSGEDSGSFQVDCESGTHTLQLSYEKDTSSYDGSDTATVSNIKATALCATHTPVASPAVAATCTETGLTEGVVCSVCGKVITAQETVPALGHDVEDGVCTRCGAAAWYVLYYDDGEGDTELAFQATADFSIDKTASYIYTIDASDKYTQASDVPWYDIRGSVKKVTFDVDVAPASTSYWFYQMGNLETINGIEHLDTSNVTDMSYMFYYCNQLTPLDVSGFDTSKVTNMRSMFECLLYLESLDVSGFDTSNVTDMSRMFNSSYSITSLDMSNFNTSKVTDMSEMFECCFALKSAAVSKFDTQQVEDMSYMFDGCGSLASLDVSKWDTSQVEDMYDMFDGCSSLASLDVSKWDTSKVENMSHMFGGCESLASLDVSKWDTSKVEDMSYMFDGCAALVSLDVSGFDTSKVEDMDSMFEGCKSLTSLDLSGFDTSKVEYMSWVFNDCESLTSLDVSGFDTLQVRDMRGMFEGCYGLTSLDLSSFITTKVKTMSEMFYGCTGLKTIYVTSRFVVPEGSDDDDDDDDDDGDDDEPWSLMAIGPERTDCMFGECESLVGGSQTAYSSEHIDGEYAHIDGGEDNPGYFTQGQRADLGDVNHNGKINIVDAQIAYDIATTDFYEDYDNYQTLAARADTDDDGQVDAPDAWAIQYYTMNGAWGSVEASEIS